MYTKDIICVMVVPIDYGAATLTFEGLKEMAADRTTPKTYFTGLMVDSCLTGFKT